MSYEIPKLLLESIQDTLYIAQRQFVRDLAKNVLKVPEADLLKIFKKETCTLNVLDCDEIRECYAFMPCESEEVIIRCRRPVMPNCSYCEEHRFIRNSVQLRVEPPVHWTPLQGSAELPALWVDESGVVYNIEKKCCGKYNRDTCELVLYDMGAE